MYSEIAIKIFAAKRLGIINTNYQFWKLYNSKEKIASLKIDTADFAQEIDKAGYSLTCVFDDNFPTISDNIKNSERPFLFAYKGDISLIGDIYKNVAVIGTLAPTDDIINREKAIVNALVEKNFNIVSGLAKGCDTVAHSQCLESCGKTIAFLPTQLGAIYPAINRQLAQNIVDNGGLIITEYIDKPKSKYECIKRFIDRDRLQAMFAQKVILVASHTKSSGDSGSRHAMQKAKEYGHERYVLYDNCTDNNTPLFGLNKELLLDDAKILTNEILNKF
jgi:DNA processing protein